MRFDHREGSVRTQNRDFNDVATSHGRPVALRSWKRVRIDSHQ